LLTYPSQPYVSTFYNFLSQGKHLISGETIIADILNKCKPNKFSPADGKKTWDRKGFQLKIVMKPATMEKDSQPGEQDKEQDVHQCFCCPVL
jgi:hypothetical protein